jgi:glucose/arabinose dehydrogenase
LMGPLIAICLFLSSQGCYRVRPSDGGGQTRFRPPRMVDAGDVQLPPGYRIELVARDLVFPTGVAFDDQGRVYVTEAGYSYGEFWADARLLRLEDDGTSTVIAASNNGPWNGVVWHEGNFYVAEGGQRDGGRILKISPKGEVERLVDGLPSFGDHHTNGPAIGPDGYIYFGQGSVTNSGVVGPDNADFGWLRRYPDMHDIPARDVRLTGVNYTTPNVLGLDKATTGAYSPYGVWTRPGQIVPGEVPCTGAIMRMPLAGGDLEVVAWGLRNPYGLAFTREGKLLVTENQYDVRGSRPVFGAGDLLWQIQPGLWYGWPDYYAGQRLTDQDRFQAPFHAAPKKLLAVDPNPPPTPAAKFPVHSSACGLDLSRSEAFGFVDDAFVAEFGDMAPGVDKVMAPVGFQVARVDRETGEVHVFAANRGRRIAPASKEHRHGLERPIAVRFNPAGDALYVVDFGVLTMTNGHPHPYPGTGVLWRITKEPTPPEPLATEPSTTAPASTEPATNPTTQPSATEPATNPIAQPAVSEPATTTLAPKEESK